MACLCALMRRLGWRGRLSSTSVPSPGTERMTAVPPWRCILPRIDSAMPLRSSATASVSNPAPRSRTNMDTLLGSASTKIETELCSRPFRRVHRRLSARGQELPQLVVEGGVADSHGVDGYPVGGFDLALDLLDTGRQGRRAL